MKILELYSKEETKNLKVGIMVLSIALLIFFIVLFSRDEITHQGGGKYYQLYARFNRTDGLLVGDLVRLAGMDIGRVVNARLDSNFKAIMTLEINEKIKLPEDSSAAIVSSGIMGSKYMGKIDESLLRPVKPGEAFYVGDIKVNAFSIPHDAADPVSYTLESESTKLGMVTDLGYFDHYIVDQLRSSDVLYVEANHDVNMLQVGPYPYYLKQRILGSHGHLCNEMSGKLVRELLNDRLTHVVLGHLSKENNFPELALKTVQMECDGAKPVFMVAPRSCAGPLINMG